MPPDPVALHISLTMVWDVVVTSLLAVVVFSSSARGINLLKRAIIVTLQLSVHAFLSFILQSESPCFSLALHAVEKLLSKEQIQALHNLNSAAGLAKHAHFTCPWMDPWDFADRQLHKMHDEVFHDCIDGSGSVLDEIFQDLCLQSHTNCTILHNSFEPSVGLLGSALVGFVDSFIVRSESRVLHDSEFDDSWDTFLDNGAGRWGIRFRVGSPPPIGLAPRPPVAQTISLYDALFISEERSGEDVATSASIDDNIRSTPNETAGEVRQVGVCGQTIAQTVRGVSNQESLSLVHSMIGQLMASLSDSTEKSMQDIVAQTSGMLLALQQKYESRMDVLQTKLEELKAEQGEVMSSRLDLAQQVLTLTSRVESCQNVVPILGACDNCNAICDGLRFWQGFLFCNACTSHETIFNNLSIANSGGRNLGIGGVKRTLPFCRPF